MSLIRPITRSDIKGPKLYGPIRDDFRARVIELKKPRRVLVGDRVSMVFENRHTLTLQIEEILRAENITSDDGIKAEIDVYNALRSEEHTSELQSQSNLVCRLLLEKKNDKDPLVVFQ